MPRRTRPVKRQAGFTVDEADCDGIDKAIRSVVDRFPAGALAPAKREALIQDLFDAVCFAKVGLKDLLAGKATKPEAWTADIFVKDVCDALCNAGRPTPMSANPQGKLHPQILAADVWSACKLPRIRGNLFKQMQRTTAKRMEKRVLFTIK